MGADKKPLPKDFKSLKALAEKGGVRAQYNLGRSYHVDMKGGRNYREAVKWYRKAAEQNNAKAQYSLGCMYAEGEGVAKNKTEAGKWYRKAAKQGYALAQHSLALQLSWGNEQEKREAAILHRKAAVQGIDTAQWAIGHCYDKGKGIPEDQVMAYAWYTVAELSKSGVQVWVKQAKEQLVKRMTRKQTAEALKITGDLLKKIESTDSKSVGLPDFPMAPPRIDPRTGLPIAD